MVNMKIIFLNLEFFLFYELALQSLNFENKHLPFKTSIDVTIILEKFERFLDKYHE